MMQMFRCIALAALACALSTDVLAQEAPGWTKKISLDKPLFLTIAKGETVEGLANTVTDDGVTVSTAAGLRTIPFTDIRRAEKRDGLWTGAAWGAGVGLLAGYAAAAVGDGVCEAINPIFFGASAAPDDSCRSNRTPALLKGAVVGSLAGLGIDMLVRGKHTIFDRAASPQVALGATPTSLSARLTFNWR